VMLVIAILEPIELKQRLGRRIQAQEYS